MEGILLKLNKEQRKGLISTRNDMIGNITIYFSEVPASIKTNSTVSFKLCKSALQELNGENYYGYYKTKAAANISPVKPDQWSPIFDDYYFHLFTYEYQNGKWKLVRSQATTDLGDYTTLGDEEHYDVYIDIDKDAVYNPLDIYLIKNYAKSPHQWVKRRERNY